MTFTLTHHTPDGRHITVGSYPEFMHAVYNIESLADSKDQHGGQLEVDYTAQTAALRVTELDYTSWWTVKETRP